jgi:hypothetical protein
LGHQADVAVFEDDQVTLFGMVLAPRKRLRALNQSLTVNTLADFGKIGMGIRLFCMHHQMKTTHHLNCGPVTSSP